MFLQCNGVGTSAFIACRIDVGPAYACEVLIFKTWRSFVECYGI